MMTTSGRVTSCCVALFFALTSVTAIQRLNSINDLRRINFGRAVPKHSLLLLYWFANTVEINYTDDIWLDFDPNRGDYGSHYYGNFEELLVQLHRESGYNYYTVGNLVQDGHRQFPNYVINPPAQYSGSNMDRIIIRVRENTRLGNRRRIDQVYITQHGENQSGYDPQHTYQITTNLLRQIREFSVGQNQQEMLALRNRYESTADISHIRNTWGDLAGLGLLLFIVIQGSFNQHNNRPEHSYTANYNEPQFNFTAQSKYRPEYNYRLQSNYRPQSSYRPQSNYRPENRHSDWNDDGALVACFVVAFVIIILIGLAILGFVTLGK